MILQGKLVIFSLAMNAGLPGRHLFRTEEWQAWVRIHAIRVMHHDGFPETQSDLDSRGRLTNHRTMPVAMTDIHHQNGANSKVTFQIYGQ
ncbi:MAG: hypothetical protein LR011_05730 [Verrucomicrobia bacterium]|nr:hypothetical protein [Verrucomicrobiota bacterium]